MVMSGLTWKGLSGDKSVLFVGFVIEGLHLYRNRRVLTLVYS